MAHKYLFEALDRTMRDITGKDELMGGIVLVCSGDFRQTLPVIPRSTPADEINACLKSSRLWSEVQILKLSTNMRVHLTGNPELAAFASSLLDLGEGNYPVTDLSNQVDLSGGLWNIVSTETALIKAVYPNLYHNYLQQNWLKERCIVAPRNDAVNDLNLKIQELIPGEVHIYKSIDTVLDADQAVFYPTEFLNSQNPPGIPSHLLHLKVGSPIILLRNLDPPNLCNGTRLRVKHLYQHLIEATIMTGDGAGTDVFIPRIPLIPSDIPFEFKRIQFPVRLAYAMSINKSQGQTFEVVGMDLRTPCFSHGQLYVGASRVGNPRNLFMLAEDGKTTNIVYKMAIR